MGCGKTLQTLGLMLSNPPAANAAATATLIVCPVSVVSNWVQQIEAHVKPNTFRVGIYMGSKTKRSQLLTKVHNGDLDVLLVSYETLRSDYVDSQAKKKEEKQEAVATATDATATTPVTEDDTPKKKKVRMEETLMNVAFHRVVLDEAHAIRNSHTSAYHAAKHLKATFKLALTGTPFVNSPGE
jgi:SWI/SNF-related matrix-associated actin-dependent regulator of chromatin subfamily A3